MGRLTIKYCGEFVPKDMCRIDQLGRADDCDLCCEYCKATKEGSADCIGCAISQSFNKLGEYEDLEEQGKLLKLPCAVGDKVYTLNPLQSGKIVIGETTADAFMCALSMLEGRFGKTIFLTLEEAEAALKEAEGLRGYWSAGGSRSDEGGKGNQYLTPWEESYQNAIQKETEGLIGEPGEKGELGVASICPKELKILRRKERELECYKDIGLTPGEVRKLKEEREHGNLKLHDND